MSQLGELPRVFIGCSSESLPLAEALVEKLQPVAHVKIWTDDVFVSGSYFLESIEEAANSSDYGIFIWSDDDQVMSQGKRLTTARDNVVLETGIFLGKLGRQRTFLLFPEDAGVKVPTDLGGLVHLPYAKQENALSALTPAARKIRERIIQDGFRGDRPRAGGSAPEVFGTLDAAREQMKSDAIRSTRIRILANRGLVFFGTDESILPLHDARRFELLQKLRLVLLSPDSRWIHDGLIQLRKYESLEVFRRSLESAHEVVELALSRFNALRPSPLNCGVRSYACARLERGTGRR